jgi:hypothetical protein
VRVTVDAARGVEVVLPRRAGPREAAAAIAELRPWIERRVADLERTHAAVQARGDTIPYLGQTLQLIPQARRTRVHRSGDRLLVPDGDHRPALERWYRRVARTEITPRLDLAAAGVDRTYRSLTIRAQRTRWASCSPTGAMSFNWRLLLAPEPVLDYVVWHEACHLRLMDHSPRFWALLARHCPEYREHSRWLRRYGGTLIL